MRTIIPSIDDIRFFCDMPATPKKFWRTIRTAQTG
jgi:hypothetical protein